MDIKMNNPIYELNKSLQQSINNLSPENATNTLTGENFSLTLAELIRLSENPMYPTSNNTWAIRAEVKRQLLIIAGYPERISSKEAA